MCEIMCRGMHWFTPDAAIATAASAVAALSTADMFSSHSVPARRPDDSSLFILSQKKRQNDCW